MFVGNNNMHKMIAMMLLAMMSSGAAAEWVFAARAEPFGIVDYYVDFYTIRRNGDMVKMWDMMDFKTAQVASGKRVLSSKSQKEYNCKDDGFRDISVVFYSGNLGSGNVAETKNNILDWAPVTPGSVVEILSKAACGKL